MIARRTGTLAAVGLALLVTAITILAARRQSASFDEIFMVASGARGFATGEFNLANDHPPAMQYLYGLPVHLSGVNQPEGVYDMRTRFEFARAFYFQAGNDPERIAFWSRLVAALLTGTLVFAVYAFTAAREGPAAGLLAGTLVGFTPDFLGHGGVAYNDVPIVLVFFLALWTIDRAVREPTLARVAIAALTIGAAMAVKFSALALGPIAIALLALEAVSRGRDSAWWRRVAIALPVAVVVFYLTLVLANRGDFSLDMYRQGLAWALFHSGKGHSVPAFLLGRFSDDGFWYFYPVLFLLKTPAALHVLMLMAAGFGLYRLRRAPDAPGAQPRWRSWIRSPYRALTIGVLVFLAILVRANLNIGLRHALPLVPPLLVLTAVGVTRLATGHRRVRQGVYALVALFVTSTLAQYPNFLSYTSEYIVDRDRADHYFADSSLDWGQGLLQLRDWMRENDIPRVYLSYFGSALPEGYGIDYVAMTGYFQIFTPMPDSSAGPLPTPEWMVISATNRAGIYLDGKPFEGFRDIPPQHVIANHLYVYPAPAP